MVGTKNEHDLEKALQVRTELGRNGITITRLAKAMGKNRTTVNLWLLNGTTMMRYDAMLAAIKRIAEGK